tara:strand:- start:4458 stop:6050 length:1593 start_codon:yes stop_codon:yes gene_type:complete
MSKRVTIYSNVGHFIEVFEIQLEIAQQHLDKGDSVEFVFCSGLVPICEINRKKDIFTCTYCISRRNQGIKLLSKKIKKLNLERFFDNKDQSIISNLKLNFESREELQNYKLADFSIGSSVYSSIADFDREYLFDLKKYKKEVRDFLVASARVYLSFTKYLLKRKRDVVYLYNGRHALEKPVIASCKALGVKFFTHEFAYNGGYDLFENTQPQDHEYRYKQIEKVWRNSKFSEAKKVKIGSLFYKQNLGRQQGNISLKINKENVEIVKNKYDALDKLKTKRELPESWDSTKENIVWFPSSEFEDYTAPDYCNDKIIYSTQLEAITKIIRDTNRHSDRHWFYIRLHPTYSLFHTEVQEQNQYESLQKDYRNVTLIYPDSEYCSYFLMDNADKVVAFRSTAGIEAAYRKKIVIMLNRHIIYKLNSVYAPKTHNEVIQLMLDPMLKPLDNRDAIKYGYFCLMSGIQPKYYKRDLKRSYEEGWGLFKDTRINPSYLIEKIVLPLSNRNKLSSLRHFINKLHQKIIHKYLNIQMHD